MYSTIKSKMLMRQLKELTQDPHVQSYFYYESSKEDHASKQFLISGYLLPQSEPYKYGSYKVLITIPADFPFRRPEMDLLTRIYHPAVNDSTRRSYCSGCCNRQWSAALSISQMIELFVIAIDHPEDASTYCVMDHSAKRLFNQNRIQYEATALAMVKAFACPRPSSSHISLKLACRQLICQQLNFNSMKTRELPLPNHLKQYLDPSIDSN